MKNSPLPFSVGALLYCPAGNEHITASVSQEKFGQKYSLALCLEDTIADDFVAQAEQSLVHSLCGLYEKRQASSFFMPNIFVRVRNAVQIPKLLSRLGDAAELLCGFILPKFDLGNADGYLHAVQEANVKSGQQLSVLPIMESSSIVDKQRRIPLLYALKDRLDQDKELVLNIRVGGNDLCSLFGFRRHQSESIHGILPIADIFSDIITVFGMEYVISGPVFEYYGGTGWERGLRQELAQDRLAGFIGKTVIHPKQIPFVNEAYAVTAEDFADAKAIMEWENMASFVAGSAYKHRMNEYKTHKSWAKKILCLAKAYGVAE